MITAHLQKTGLYLGGLFLLCLVAVGGIGNRRSLQAGDITLANLLRLIMRGTNPVPPFCQLTHLRPRPNLPFQVKQRPYPQPPMHHLLAVTFAPSMPTIAPTSKLKFLHKRATATALL